MSQYSLGVYLQILLAVGLAVFCYCLVLSCILCCRRKKNVPSEDGEATFLSSPSQNVTLGSLPGTQAVKQQYEELDGEVMLLVSSKSSSSGSEDDLTALPFDLSPASSLQDSLPLRRLSTPAASSFSDKSLSHGRASLPSRLGFVSRRVMGRRSTVSGDSLVFAERSHLISRNTKSSCQQYGSNSISIFSKSTPLLHFSLLFSSTCGTLMVNILGLSGDGRRRGRVFVRASLPPLYPSAVHATPRRRSLSPDLHSQSFVLHVRTVEELRMCTLWLVVYNKDFSGLREVTLGLVEFPCEQIDWEAETTTTFTRQLSPAKSKLKKV